jgi:hypothetical protein
LNPPGILLVEDVGAELAHQIGVVHLSGPRTYVLNTKPGSLIQRLTE